MLHYLIIFAMFGIAYVNYSRNMKYNNQPVRRQDRLLSEESAVMLLCSGEYGILSMQSESGGGYGIPVNYVWDNHSSIYIHCAPEGEKLRNLQGCNKVSFCVVGNTFVLSREFSTEYESIILQGEAQTGLSDDERKKALGLIIDKYSPNDKIIGEKYIEKSFGRTEVIRLNIESWSGKSRASKREKNQ